MPWKDQSHKNTNILLVRPKLSEPADTITGLDALHLTSRVMGSFHANAIILDQEGSIIPNIEQEDSYRAIIQSRPAHEVSEQFAVQVQWEDNWDWHQIFQQEKPETVNVEMLESDKCFHIPTGLKIPADFPWGKFVTTNVEQEDPDETSDQYLHRREILDRFDVLAQREDNWDGYESKKSTELTLDHAKFLIAELLDSITSAGWLWLTPFISSDEDGNVTAEWYEEERQLHIQIGENEAEYIQVWGPNIDTEMHVDFLSRDDYLTLWEWLIDG